MATLPRDLIIKEIVPKLILRDFYVFYVALSLNKKYQDLYNEEIWEEATRRSFKRDSLPKKFRTWKKYYETLVKDARSVTDDIIEKYGIKDRYINKSAMISSIEPIIFNHMIVTAKCMSYHPYSKSNGTSFLFECETETAEQITDKISYFMSSIMTRELRREIEYVLRNLDFK